MRKVEANTNRLTIELIVNGEKAAEIMINPSFPGGCDKIYKAMAHDAGIAKRSMDTTAENKRDAVIEYMKGKFDVAGELIDGIAEAIGPGQYYEIADILPVIEFKDLMALAAAIVDSYCEYYTNALKQGYKTNG